MSESPTARLFALVATAVGIVTGIGTIVGWIASQSLADTLHIVLPVAGLVYLAIGLGYWFLRPLQAGDPSELRRRLLAAIIVIPAAVLVVMVSDKRERSVYFRGLGAAGLASAAALAWVAGPSLVRERRAARKAAHKPCPDCCETVKADARVCRYCGWRFAPPPVDGP